jgi:hypothetical protein
VSRYLLAVLQEDVDATQRAAAWQWIMLGPAVDKLVDLGEVNQVTLETILRPPSPDLERIYQRSSRKPKRKESVG